MFLQKHIIYNAFEYYSKKDNFQEDNFSKKGKKANCQALVQVQVRAPVPTGPKVE